MACSNTKLAGLSRTLLRNYSWKNRLERLRITKWEPRTWLRVKIGCVGNYGHLPDMRRKHRSGGDTTSKAPSSGVWTWFVNGFVFEKGVRGPVKAESPKLCGLKVFDQNFNKYALLNWTSMSEKQRYVSVTLELFIYMYTLYSLLCKFQVVALLTAETASNESQSVQSYPLSGVIPNYLTWHCLSPTWAQETGYNSVWSYNVVLHSVYTLWSAWPCMYIDISYYPIRLVSSAVIL